MTDQRPPEPPVTDPAGWLAAKAESYARDGRKFREAGTGKTRPILGREQDAHWASVYWAVADELRKLAGEFSDRDRSALDRIVAILSSREWDADAINAVADVLRTTGREISDLGGDA